MKSCSDILKEIDSAYVSEQGCLREAQIHDQGPTEIYKVIAFDKRNKITKLMNEYTLNCSPAAIQLNKYKSREHEKWLYEQFKRELREYDPKLYNSHF